MDVLIGELTDNGGGVLAYAGLDDDDPAAFFGVASWGEESVAEIGEGLGESVGVVFDALPEGIGADADEEFEGGVEAKESGDVV